jgi:hypothetical protein
LLSASNLSNAYPTSDIGVGDRSSSRAASFDRAPIYTIGVEEAVTRMYDANGEVVGIEIASPED